MLQNLRACVQLDRTLSCEHVGAIRQRLLEMFIHQPHLCFARTSKRRKYCGGGLKRCNVSVSKAETKGKNTLDQGEFISNSTAAEAAPQGRTSLLFYSVEHKPKKWILRAAVCSLFTRPVRSGALTLRSGRLIGRAIFVPVNKRGRGINLLLQKDVLALADGDMSPIILLVWGLFPAGTLNHMLTQRVGERQSGLPEMWRFSCDTHHLAALFLLCYSLPSLPTAVSGTRRTPPPPPKKKKI